MKYGIAHRGNGKHPYQENTKEAFLFCLNHPKIAGIELDVWLTKDHKLAVTHDMMIGRVSDGFGAVPLMKLKELRKYNFGSVSHPSKIATLAEVLDLVKDDKIIVIELKTLGNHLEKMVDQVAQTLQHYQQLNLRICSFSYELVLLFKKKYPFYKVGYIKGYGINYLEEDRPFDFISYSVSLAKKVNLDKELLFWNIETKQELVSLKKEVSKDFLFATDHPEEFYSLLEK